MKECKQLYPLLAAYAGSELTPGRHAQVAAHVNGCARCADRVSTIMPVVQTLAAEAAAPRWHASPTFRNRLERGIHEEIEQRTRPKRVSLRRALFARPLTTGLAGATLALVMVMVFFMTGGPSTADTLDDALRAIARCKTVHVTGYTNLFSSHDEQRHSVNPRRMDPLEIWWSKDGRIWMRVGDSVWMRNGGEWLPPKPLKGKIATRRAFRDLNELASAENYLRRLRTLARDRETHTSSELRGRALKLTITAGPRRDFIEIDAPTKLLVRAESSNGSGDLAVRRQLDHFTYDQPFPGYVLKHIDAVLQPQDQPTRLQAISSKKGGDK